MRIATVKIKFEGCTNLLDCDDLINLLQGINNGEIDGSIESIETEDHDDHDSRDAYDCGNCNDGCCDCDNRDDGRYESRVGKTWVEYLLEGEVV